MSDLYNRIHALCQQKDVSIGKMCNELGISRGNLTELKMGRIKTLKADNLTKISHYFGVSIDYLLGAEDAKKEVIHDDKVNDRDIKFALFNGDKGVTDAQFDEVKRFAAYVRERDRLAGKINKE